MMLMGCLWPRCSLPRIGDLTGHQWSLRSPFGTACPVRRGVASIVGPCCCPILSQLEFCGKGSELGRCGTAPVRPARMSWHKAALQWRRDIGNGGTSPGDCRGSMALFELAAAAVAPSGGHWTRGETGSPVQVLLCFSLLEIAESARSRL